MDACSASRFRITEISGVAMYSNYHVSGIICEHSFFLCGQVIEELLCLTRVFLVGLADCDAMALIGNISVLSTARPRKINFTHTCWMNRFPFLSKSGAADF